MQSIFLLKFVRFSVEISVPHRSAMIRKETIMKLNDFLKPELLGNRFFAVKGYTEVLDRETNKPIALRLNVSIQDETSDFFMEMIQVKVNTLTPTASVQKWQTTRLVLLHLKI